MSNISDDGLWKLVDGKWIPNQQQGTSQTSEEMGVDLSDTRTKTVECPSCGTLLWGVKVNHSGTLGCKSCGFYFDYPIPTDFQQLIARLGKIEGRLNGISSTIWLVFFFIPFFAFLFFIFL